MSRYAYGYSVAPVRPTGWRSLIANLGVVTAVVVLSGISGAVVAFNLVGGPPRDDTTLVAVPPATLPIQAATPVIAAPAIRAAPVRASQIQKAEQPVARPAVAAAVTAPPVAAPQPAPAAVRQAAPAALASRDDTTAAIPASELTFAKGYALRRAARLAAAAQGVTPKVATPTAATTTAATETATGATETVKVAETQFGRPAIKRKPKPSLLAQSVRPERYGMFERFDGNTRHQALAFGDSSQSRPVRRSGGWFDGLF